MLEKTNKILINLSKDSNLNKVFDGEDESLSMIYDLKTQVLTKNLFKDDFKLKLQQILETHWFEKE